MCTRDGSPLGLGRLGQLLHQPVEAVHLLLEKAGPDRAAALDAAEKASLEELEASQKRQAATAVLAERVQKLASAGGLESERCSRETRIGSRPNGVRAGEET